jgi:hypothetical protein
MVRPPAVRTATALPPNTSIPVGQQRGADKAVRPGADHDGIGCCW